ncbi:hypothetical protein RWE15_09320 [Virgibacillus halophilus]|uniref:Uncharacterized protein n=1 Tax=Tigheibacillus halophilus TaxID=361280 RepID=A0ABU5C5K2_9BACI|nr:hypothetical protein [Virgibacillus halophilus]
MSFIKEKVHSDTNQFFQNEETKKTAFTIAGISQSGLPSSLYRAGWHRENDFGTRTG